MAEISKLEFLIKRHLKIPMFRLYCFIGRLLSPLTNKRIQRGRIAKILIFQGGGIGDVIRIFPLFWPLHKEFPNASISVLSPHDRKIYDLFVHSDIISEHIVLDITGEHRSIGKKLALFRSLRKKSFDLVLCPQIGLGMIEFAILSFLTGAPYRVGYDMEGSGFPYTTKVSLQKDRSIYDQHRELLKGLVVPSPDDQGDIKFSYLKVPEEDLSFARSFLKDHGTNDRDMIFALSPIVLADTDSKSPQHDRPLAESRTWSEESYVTLVEQIVHTYPAKVLILGDRISAGPMSGFLAHQDSPQIINAVGKTTLGQSAALISLSHIMISNDSGLLHIAIALNKNCIGIFGSTSPRQVIPETESCVALWKGLECSPCFVHQPIPDFKCRNEMKCLRSISVEDVMQAVTRLLGTNIS